jgi:hypothetical protein
MCQEASAAIDIDRIARAIDPGKMGVRGVAQLIETLDLLARADSAIDLSGVRTATLVRLLARASTAQLDAVAALDTARSVVLAEVFDRMAAHLRVDRAASVSAVVRWRIGCGQPDVDFHRFQTVIDLGSCRTTTVLDQRPRVTLTLGMVDFLRLVSGAVGAARLLAGRRLGLRGDLRFAIRLVTLFDIPTT